MPNVILHVIKYKLNNKTKAKMSDDMKQMMLQMMQQMQQQQNQINQLTKALEMKNNSNINQQSSISQSSGIKQYNLNSMFKEGYNEPAEYNQNNPKSKASKYS
jgi:hypothetical protein